MVTSWPGLYLAHQAALCSPGLIMLHLGVFHLRELLVANILAQLFVCLHLFSLALCTSSKRESQQGSLLDISDVLTPFAAYEVKVKGQDL